MVIRQEQVVYHPSFLPAQSAAGRVRTGEVLPEAAQPVLWPGTMGIGPGRERQLWCTGGVPQSHRDPAVTPEAMQLAHLFSRICILHSPTPDEKIHMMEQVCLRF